MKDLFWFAKGCQSSPFVDLIYEPGGEGLLDSYQVEHTRFDNTSACLFQPGTLPTLSRWLRDDWIDLLGYAAHDADPGEIADGMLDASKRSRDKYYSVIEHEVELCFFCVDGFSWEFYCHNDSAITAVFEHVSRMEGVRLARGRLRYRDQIRCDFHGGHHPAW